MHENSRLPRRDADATRLNPEGEVNPVFMTLSAPSSASLSGGSATSYIRGALLRTMQASVSADGQSYFFPIGDSIYRPFTLAVRPA